MTLFNSESTASVLRDVAALRRKTEEALKKEGLEGVTHRIPDGFTPEGVKSAMSITLNALRNPAWANTLLAQAAIATTSKDAATARGALIALAAHAVAWVEQIDAREDQTLA